MHLFNQRLSCCLASVPRLNSPTRDTRPALNLREAKTLQPMHVHSLSALTLRVGATQHGAIVAHLRPSNTVNVLKFRYRPARGCYRPIPLIALGTLTIDDRLSAVGTILTVRYRSFTVRTCQKFDKIP